MSNTIRMRCSGKTYTLTLDVATWMGDAVEEFEAHIGGENIFAWAQRLVAAFEHGFRIRDFRACDLVGMVFLARAQAEPGVSWQEVSRSIAPYTLEVIEDDAPATPPPVTVGVSPDLGQAVPQPASLSPTLAALGSSGAHEAAAAPPEPADFYRSP